MEQITGYENLDNADKMAQAVRFKIGKNVIDFVEKRRVEDKNIPAKITFSDRKIKDDECSTDDALDLLELINNKLVRIAIADFIKDKAKEAEAKSKELQVIVQKL